MFGGRHADSCLLFVVEWDSVDGLVHCCAASGNNAAHCGCICANDHIFGWKNRGSGVRAQAKPDTGTLAKSPSKDRPHQSDNPDNQPDSNFSPSCLDLQ